MSEFPTGGGSGYVVPRRLCLFGVTILLIEDSRSASEAIRLFAQESGARLRRADSLGAAQRHLAIYRPNVVMVDLGLPDGDGLGLIRHLASASSPIRAIVATSGHDPADWQKPAIEAGAAACLPKPVPSLKTFQNTLLALLPDRGGTASENEFAVAGSASVHAALEEDLRRARALIDDAVRIGDADTVAYAARFLVSLGASPEEAAIGRAARDALEGIRAGQGAAVGAPLVTELDRRLETSRVRGAA